MSADASVALDLDDEVSDETPAEEEGDAMCSRCNGTGEGMSDGSWCTSCGGSGVPRQAREDDDCDEDAR